MTKRADALVGRARDHGTGPHYRANLRRLAFEQRLGFELLERDTGSVERIVVTGGAMQRRFLLQLFASAMGRPLARRPRRDDPLSAPRCGGSPAAGLAADARSAARRSRAAARRRAWRDADRYRSLTKARTSVIRTFQPSLRALALARLCSLPLSHKREAAHHSQRCARRLSMRVTARRRGSPTPGLAAPHVVGSHPRRRGCRSRARSHDRRRVQKRLAVWAPAPRRSPETITLSVLGKPLHSSSQTSCSSHPRRARRCSSASERLCRRKPPSGSRGRRRTPWDRARRSRQCRRRRRWPRKKERKQRKNSARPARAVTYYEAERTGYGWIVDGGAFGATGRHIHQPCHRPANPAGEGEHRRASMQDI